MMNVNPNGTSDAMLEDVTDEMILDPVAGDLADVPVQPAPRRDLPQMMRKIPVTLTLEVGSARISLQDLMSIGPDSVVELDVLAGEPLVIKVNGTAIGRAEVVVAGENYGLKVIDLDGLNLDMMTS
ncbi:flagellar motor switch protein FliN [Pseudoduganella plicata]|uniref:Flagellar motor switch protein FliN n=2 Tax=Pseudoduganella plicata TaxID=321984 RepID=A0A4P7BCQ1_9BURK|nr:flagellar motor switch protein FliN [Pseudoduganella plicata]GGY96009.1 flagellar motor switch protein FliN [Pseudoduganella plicata]